jgi:hypothetical protein
MQPGDLVIIIGKLDDKIRQRNYDNLICGTYWGTVRLENADVAVLLENGDIYVGLRRDVILKSEQE